MFVAKSNSAKSLVWILVDYVVTLSSSSSLAAMIQNMKMLTLIPQFDARTSSL